MARSVKSKEKEPADWQESHSPTMPVLTRITGQRRMETTKRRTAAVRLFDGLLEDDQQAMVEINYVHNTFPGKSNIMMYEADYVPGTGDAGTRDIDLRRVYFTWASIRKFNHAAAMDIIGFGMNLKDVDHNRRKRHGWAKENLKDALKEWRTLRGWR